MYVCVCGACVCVCVCGACVYAYVNMLSTMSPLHHTLHHHYITNLMRGVCIQPCTQTFLRPIRHCCQHASPGCEPISVHCEVEMMAACITGICRTGLCVVFQASFPGLLTPVFVTCSTASDKHWDENEAIVNHTSFISAALAAQIHNCKT